ncbi:MAG: hypothetical protein IT374_10780 [Polyangiaceae bacterium]|nr:hypothetical protein [Polyangiaceae bacterium]
MPIGALVVTLDPDPARRAAALLALSADARVTVGEPRGGRLPVVSDTATLEEGDRLFRELAEVPGVLFVDVVSVDFSDLEGETPSGQA